jgi:hypothetical protein
VKGRPRVSLRIACHVPESAKECEEMNLHITKGAATLGAEIPMDFRIFRR